MKTQQNCGRSVPVSADKKGVGRVDFLSVAEPQPRVITSSLILEDKALFEPERQK